VDNLLLLPLKALETAQSRKRSRMVRMLLDYRTGFHELTGTELHFGKGCPMSRRRIADKLYYRIHSKGQHIDVSANEKRTRRKALETAWSPAEWYKQGRRERRHENVPKDLMTRGTAQLRRSAKDSLRKIPTLRESTERGDKGRRKLSRNSGEQADGLTARQELLDND
jgi:hypothetical protein